jgi:hypothetical protein
VWGQRNAEGEQVMLARCMDILDRHALITGPLLDPAYPWEPEDSLRVAINHLSTEDMLRLWDSLEPPYQLSVPYVVRTARLAARERPIRPSPIRAPWSSRPRCRDARRRRHAPRLGGPPLARPHRRGRRAGGAHPAPSPTRAARPHRHPRPAGARRRPPRTPLWHESTGLYGFLRLPPGEARIEIDDPAGRYQAQAVSATVPDRGRSKPSKPARPPRARPAYPTALRPALGHGPAPGTSAVWGVVRDGGRPVAGALLSHRQRADGAADTITAMSGPDGSYLLVLPFESSTAASARRCAFERALTVHAPRPALAAALAPGLPGRPAGRLHPHAGRAQRALPAA